MNPVDMERLGRTTPCLQDLLYNTANTGRGKLIFYSPGNTTTPKAYSYSELLSQAKQNSRFLLLLPSFKRNHPVLIHLTDHWDAILWFWAVLLAGGLPVLSPTLSNIDSHRQRHTEGLSILLESPLCLTRIEFLPLFDGEHTLQLYTIESILDGPLSPKPDASHDGRDADKFSSNSDSTAALMLTSGSTGSAKAVCLTHGQIITAIKGKAMMRNLPTGGAFLNWIGLDHVASLVEIHLQALWLGVDQVHVYATDVVSDPRVFIALLSKHQVARSFAPNFFLARLISSIQQGDKDGAHVWNLSNLTVLASGGEANDTKTCLIASALLQKYGAPRHVITPGFGMTETCGGAIFNLECPDYDVENGLALASVGKCMPGIDMRVTLSCEDPETGLSTQEATFNEPGNLEVRGAAVFAGYYRNENANMQAFPSGDGWFRTGDLALLDSAGNLRLLGRTQDIININSVKIVIDDLQAHLELQIGSLASRIVVFPTRAAHTEQVTVVWLPHGWPVDEEAMITINRLVVQTCIEMTSSRPVVFSLQEKSLPLLPTSALGKVSRARMRALFESGAFNQDLSLYEEAVIEFNRRNLKVAENEAPSTEETVIIADFASTLGRAAENISPNVSVFELGFTSMDLIHLKHRIDTRFRLSVPIVTFLKHSNARSLALAIRKFLSPIDEPREHPPSSVEYEPVVTLRSGGTKTPLWLVHPGVGEVLVFVNLAWHLVDDDRPIYALRARGFEPGETHFCSIAETVDSYVLAVRRRQPEGPYAIAGYSYGAMLAFEMAKQLDKLDSSPGGAVKFLGSFNLPPHIKSRMRQLSWNMCLLHLFQFLGLVTEEYVENIEEDYRAQSRSTALATVIAAACGRKDRESFYWLARICARATAIQYIFR